MIAPGIIAEVAWSRTVTVTPDAGLVPGRMLTTPVIWAAWAGAAVTAKTARTMSRRRRIGQTQWGASASLARQRRTDVVMNAAALVPLAAVVNRLQCAVAGGGRAGAAGVVESVEQFAGRGEVELAAGGEHDHDAGHGVVGQGGGDLAPALGVRACGRPRR